MKHCELNEQNVELVRLWRKKCQIYVYCREYIIYNKTMENKDLILKLRSETGAGVMDAKNALAEFSGDYEKAKAELLKLGLAKAAKKADRQVTAGLVESY